MMRFLFILFLSAAINSVEARRVAIVFGNSKYAPEMQSAAIDAEYIIKKLKLAEFDIINDKVYNLTRSDLASEIQKASNIISEGDDMIVYYSGHGIQCNGKNYIIPIDYDLSNTECETNKLYSIENFLDLLGSKNARLKLLILDACRNSTASSKNGLAESKVLSDAMIWYSSDFNSFSLPADSGNSLFTKHLLVQLDRGQTDPSTITDIFDRAKNMVEK